MRADISQASSPKAGLSQSVGPINPDETVEAVIYFELPNPPAKGPDYEFFVKDELGHVVQANKP